MKTRLLTLHGYHAWANRDLLAKLGHLNPKQQETDMREALRRLGHIYVVADIFAAHLIGRSHDHATDGLVDVPSLSAMTEMMAAQDEWYARYLQVVSGEALAQSISFTFTDGDEGFMSREEMITHVVLHGGYHRGEIGHRLSQISAPLPWDTFAVYLHQTDPGRRLHGRARPKAS